MKKYCIIFIALFLSACHSDQSNDLLGCGHDHSSDNEKEIEARHTHSHDDNSEHEHDNESNHGHSHQSHDEYDVIDIAYTPFGEVIKTGGEILPVRGDEQVVVANHDGLAFFALKGIQEGVDVKTNQHLLTITSGELVHDNLEAGYLDAKAQFEKKKIDYERAARLMADTIIPEREYLDAKLAYESSRLSFNTIRRNYESGGQKVLAPNNGYVKTIHVNEGEFVQIGQPLVTISQNKRIVIKADVPQNAIPKLKTIVSANFKTPYRGQTYSTNELNGNLISWGKSATSNSYYIPIFFEIDNKGALIPGTYIEVFLKTAAIAEAIAIPKSAVMEEFGSHFVFVDNHDGWEKRYIEIGGTDGDLVKVTQGLKVGEHVATKNVSRIKLSQMTGQLPEHAHVH
ncbi:MAG: efflux RND transporter periplasmic adaptor subunit [Bacteroidales bacterium]